MTIRNAAERALVHRLREMGVIVKRPVTLRGGEKSEVYYDIKRAYGDPSTLSEFADMIIRMLPSETTCVVGSGHGGIPLATAIALRANLRLTLAREKSKDHGLVTLLDGYIPTQEDVLVIVDDVLTTGNSLRKTYGALGPQAANVRITFVMLDRSDDRSGMALNGHVHGFFTPQDFDDVSLT